VEAGSRGAALRDADTVAEVKTQIQDVAEFLKLVHGVQESLDKGIIRSPPPATTVRSKCPWMSNSEKTHSLSPDTGTTHVSQPRTIEQEPGQHLKPSPLSFAPAGLSHPKPPAPQGSALDKFTVNVTTGAHVENFDMIVSDIPGPTLSKPTTRSRKRARSPTEACHTGTC
jgi:hypothetical protein